MKSSKELKAVTNAMFRSIDLEFTSNHKMTQKLILAASVLIGIECGQMRNQTHMKGFTHLKDYSLISSS